MTIIRCTCKHEYQDRAYGRGNRVANKTTKSDPPGYRCTVCGREHERKDIVKETK